MAVAVRGEEEIDGESRIDAVRGGELAADGERVFSHDLGVASVREDGEGDARSGAVDVGGAAVESAETAERSVELVSEQCDNGVLREPEVCVKENGRVEGCERLEIEGEGPCALANGVEGASDLHVEQTNKALLSKPENLREGVAEVQINGREDVQVEGDLAPARLELPPDEEEVPSSVPVSSVNPHDECGGSHTESKDGLTLHVEDMSVITFGDREVEAERSEPREIVYSDKKSDVNGTCPESFVVGSIDCEIRDIVLSPDTGVLADVRGGAPLGSFMVEANGHSLDEVPDLEDGEVNKDGHLETRENFEVCLIDDAEQQLARDSTSIKLEELNANAKSLEPEFREDTGEGDEVKPSLSCQGVAHSERNVDVASFLDSNPEQKLEGSNNVDAHTQERDAASSDGCPNEEDREGDISTILTPTEEDHVCDNISLEIPIENEAPAHDTTTIEICEDCPPVNVDDDVQREIKLDEENSSASVTQDKLSSEDDDEKQAHKGDGGDDGVRANGGVAPSTIEDTAGLGIGSRFFMIRIPRFQDEKLAAQLQRAEACLEDRTHKRDLIGIKIREKMTSSDEYKKNFNEARNEERTAREAFLSKQQEVIAIHSTADKIEIAKSIDNVVDRIQYLSHKMQHETISLKEEKQSMREIKELNKKHDHLSKMAPQSEMQKAFEQKDQIEENLKRLKPELEHLRKELSQAETKTKAAWKKFNESKFLEDLRAQRKAADDLRQEAYIEMMNLKKQLSEKNKLFYNYKNDVRAAVTFASSGNKVALQKHCNDQVERFMELWNNNDEFRKQYVLANQNSTIRRFRTLDARSLGLDEQPVLLPNAAERRAENRTEVPSTSDGMRPTVGKQDKDGKPSDLSTVPETSSTHLANGKTADIPKSISRAVPQTTSTLVSDEDANAKDEERERKSAEEAELKRLADESARNEELRKEQAAAELKEKIRLEQIAKAKEAEERKRRKVERAKAAAEIRARKEAELREKKRAKKEKQKENKAASTTEAAGGTSTLADPVPGLIPEDIEEPESSTAAAMSRKQSRAPQVAKQQYKKTAPLPSALLNRRKRRMPTWGWVALFIALSFIVYLAGDYWLFSRNRPLRFGF